MQPCGPLPDQGAMNPKAIRELRSPKPSEASSLPLLEPHLLWSGTPQSRVRIFPELRHLIPALLPAPSPQSKAGSHWGEKDTDNQPLINTEEEKHTAFSEHVWMQMRCWVGKVCLNREATTHRQELSLKEREPNEET